MSNLNFDKQSCFERAKYLFDKNDDSLLRYICLELRFCIEDIVYDKLKIYVKRLPQSVIETWQPPQAMKALLRLEPDANQTFSLAISAKPEPHNGEFIHVGTQQELPTQFINKTYNKLGNYLHVPTLKAQASLKSNINKQRLREDIKEIMDKLQPMVKSTFNASFAEVVTFPCDECQSLIPCNEKGLKKTGKAECLNPNCGAQFLALENSLNTWSFKFQYQIFACLKCNKENKIGKHKLKMGTSFDCDGCKTKHEIVEPLWQYMDITSSEEVDLLPK